MLVNQVYAVYKCADCGHVYRRSSTMVTMRNIMKLAAGLDRSKPCICGRQATLKQAVFETMKDKFGDARHGLWLCPLHKGFNYFPLVLKQACGHELSLAISPASELERYEAIAKAGWPWKCPICGKQMIYENSRLKSDHFIG